MDQSLINRIVEGALLASSQPLTLAQLKDLFPEEEPAPPRSIERALERLREACAANDVELFESVMSLTGMVNVGKGAVVVGFAEPPHKFA